MVKRLVIILYCIAFSCFGWEDHDSTMYWQVSGTGNTVDDGPNDVYTFLGFDHSDSDIGVRIACYDINGNLIKYLNPVYSEYGIDWDYNDEYIGTRNDLPVEARQAYLGNYNPSDYRFQMQIGTYNLEDDFVELLFTKALETELDNWYDWGTLKPGAKDWIPTEFYTINPVVPSPPPFLNLPFPFSACSVPRCSHSDARRFDA